MARQYKVQITYQNGDNAEYYMHDNNSIEIIDIPPMTTRTGTDSRMTIIEDLSDFARRYNAIGIELTKV